MEAKNLFDIAMSRMYTALASFYLYKKMNQMTSIEVMGKEKAERNQLRVLETSSTHHPSDGRSHGPDMVFRQ